MHLSIPKDSYCEFINIKPIKNTFWAKCQIKVCYVSDKPNRNGSVINEETARKMANSLPGCPIVGFYNEEDQDFEKHNRVLEINEETGEWRFTDTTKPYGFVDLNPKVWFQNFIDDNQNERKYLMTEGVIWAGIYPEVKRVIAKGNNHSMELDEGTLNGSWTYNQNGERQFFIINDAIIRKLCILGENFEPCFEGSQIKATFSLDPSFKAQIYSLMQDLKNSIEGGKKPMIDFSIVTDFVGDNAIGAFSEDNHNYALLKDNEKYYKHEFSLDENNVFNFINDPIEVDESYSLKLDLFRFEKKKDDKEDPKDSKEDSKESKDPKESEGSKKSEDPKELEEELKRKKEKEYSLDNIPEYQELLGKYSALNNSYSQVLNEKTNLESEIIVLREFKANIDKKEKESMINSFSMLSDEDKQDVVNNINTYSLDEIEQKLSVICFRKKVNFSNNNNNNNSNNEPLTYSLNSPDTHDDPEMPAWLKRVAEIEKTIH